MEGILSDIVKSEIAVAMNEVLCQLRKTNAEIIELRKGMDVNRKVIGNLQSCMESEMNEMKTCMEKNSPRDNDNVNGIITKRLGRFVNFMTKGIASPEPLAFNPEDAIEDMGLAAEVLFPPKGPMVSHQQPPVNYLARELTATKKVVPAFSTKIVPASHLCVGKSPEASSSRVSSPTQERPKKKTRLIYDDPDSSSEDDDLLISCYKDDCPDVCEGGNYVHVYKNVGGRKPKCSSCSAAAVLWVNHCDGDGGFYFCKVCKKRYHKFVSKTDRRVRNVQQWWNTQ